jgi:hypothetical protein
MESIDREIREARLQAGLNGVVLSSLKIPKKPLVEEARTNEGVACEVQRDGTKKYLTEAEYYQQRQEEQR